MLDFLSTIWEFFANNILTQPAYFIGLMVVIGYILLRRAWYDVLAGFIKATAGFMILQVGAGGLVGNFRGDGATISESFNLGTIEGTDLTTATQSRSGAYSGVGGLVGAGGSDISQVFIKNSYNKAINIINNY